MSLRARLAVAFFVALLAPVVFIATAVYAAITSTSESAPFQLPVRTLVTAQCQRLAAQAETLAVRAGIQGQTFAVTGAASAEPWAVCGVGPQAVLLPAGTHYGGLAARAEIHDPSGATIGYAYAIQALDPSFMNQLSAAAGCPVEVVGTTSAPTDSAQPLPFVCGPAEPGTGLAWYAVPVAVFAAVLTALLAWWLAGVATRPLARLLGTVERVVSGDLEVQTAIAGRDETARLSTQLDRLVGGMREAQRLSVTDALTGLGNLRQLSESLRLEVERAARFDRALGVLILDLDHFKEVNDTYGHRAGDIVLVEFARRVCGVVREVDLVFRQGGEEFVVLLPETDAPGSLTVARRIIEAVRATPIRVPHPAGPIGTELLISVTVSIGAAVFPRHAVTGTEVLDAADSALYAAKAAGRDTAVLASSMLPQPRVSSSPLAVGSAGGGTTSPRTPAAG